MPKICHWAKYQNRHSSKSIGVIKLSSCQKDPPIEESFWQKDSMITHILFETMPILIFSPGANFGHHPIFLNKNNFRKGLDDFRRKKLHWKMRNLQFLTAYSLKILICNIKIWYRAVTDEWLKLHLDAQSKM